MLSLNILLTEIVNKYTKLNLYAEIRLPIYGKKPDEWKKLAYWFYWYGIYALDRCKFAIALPPPKFAFSLNEPMTNESQSAFDGYFSNVFVPLFKVTSDPWHDLYIHWLLHYVTIIDNQQGPKDTASARKCLTIEDCARTNEKDDPNLSSYDVLLYFTYSNMATLNQLRKYEL